MPGAEGPVLRTRQVRGFAKTLLRLRFGAKPYSAGYRLEPEKPPPRDIPRSSICAAVLFRCSRNRIAELLLVPEELSKSKNVLSKGPEPAHQVAQYRRDHQLKKSTDKDYTQMEQIFQQAKGNWFPEKDK